MISQKTHELSTSEVRVLWLASIGGVLEFYDFVIFVFFATTIGKLFFASSLPDWVRQAQTFAIFAAGYLARPIGGIVMAHFGDTRGRKRMFTLSVLLMAIPTLLMGLLPTYQSIGVAAPLLLLLMRIMQGVAIGGEAPGAWVFVAEHARRGRVGFAVGLLTSGLSFGILLGSLMATCLNQVFSQTQITAGAWRIPFLIGGMFGFIAMWLRRWPLYALAGFGAGGVVLTPIVMIHAFPTSIRFSGVSFSYNCSYALFGGLTPLLVSWLAHLNRIAPAHYIAAVTAVGLCATLMAPKDELNEIDASAHFDKARV
jgi:MFS family permease